MPWHKGWMRKGWLLAGGTAIVAGLAWLDKKYGKVSYTAVSGMDSVGQIGQAAAMEYMEKMRRGQVFAKSIEVIGKRHVVVTFDPSVKQTLWGWASDAESTAVKHGLKVALATGPGKLGIVFTPDPRGAEAALAADGYTDLEASGGSALWVD